MLTEIIKPIVLLRGPHSNTDKTGRGCFMDVIAYLNGEPRITDKSECVCFVVRPIAIWLNDFLNYDERMRLLPYIERAMGSRTDDRAEYVRRAHLAVVTARTCSRIAAAKAVRWATAYAANDTADTAAYAARAARAAYAAEAAAYAAYAAYAAGAAADAASAAMSAAADAARVPMNTMWVTMNAGDAVMTARKQIIEACFTFLDAALPATVTHGPIVVARAKSLVALLEFTP